LLLPLLAAVHKVENYCRLYTEVEFALHTRCFIEPYYQ